MSEIDPLGIFWTIGVALVIGVPFLAYGIDGSFAPMLRGAAIGAAIFGGAALSVAAVAWMMGA